jgi:hypothetical protein
MYTLPVTKIGGPYGVITNNRGVKVAGDYLHLLLSHICVVQVFANGIFRGKSPVRISKMSNFPTYE